MAFERTMNSSRGLLDLRAIVVFCAAVVIATAVSGSGCFGRDGKPRIVVEARVLKYFEGENVLEFQIDWFPDGRVVYVPKLARWREEMPEWAKERRGEIFPEMRRLAAKGRHTLKWEEY
jgi:hypothetical protein